MFNLITLHRPETFQHVSSWLNDAKNLARNECSICVVGNKSDLKNDRIIKHIDGAKFCQENSKFNNHLLLDLIHFECSAFSGENIDDIFTTLAKHIMTKVDNGIIEPSSVMSCGFKKIKDDHSKSVFLSKNQSTCGKNC